MKIVRVQIDIPEDRVNELDELMGEAKISTRKELFNNALTLFEWAIQQRKKGKKICSFDEEREIIQELLMPSIQSVKATSTNPKDEQAQASAIGAATYG